MASHHLVGSCDATNKVAKKLTKVNRYRANNCPSNDELLGLLKIHATSPKTGPLIQMGVLFSTSTRGRTRQLSLFWSRLTISHTHKKVKVSQAEATQIFMQLRRQHCTNAKEGTIYNKFRMINCILLRVIVAMETTRVAISKLSEKTNWQAKRECSSLKCRSSVHRQHPIWTHRK